METVQCALARNVAELRRRRGLSVRGLSKVLGELGVPLLPSGITKLEAQDRKVSVTELLALAVALDVSPVRLLLPPEPSDVDVQITPERSAPWAAAWRWAVGDQPLLQRDDRLPLDDPRVREFIGENRPYEHRPVKEVQEFLAKRVLAPFEARITHDEANLHRRVDWDEWYDEVRADGER